MKRLSVLLFVAVFLLAGCDLLNPQAPTATPVAVIPDPTATRTPVVLPTPTEVGTPAVDQLPQVIFHDCPFETSTIKIECGSLFVKETKDDPASNVLEIAFVRYRAQLQVPAADPVVFVGSKIGYPVLEDIESTWTDFPLRYNRDLILFDARGTGSSLPSLDCPELDGAADIDQRNALQICYTRLQNQGINLNAYHSAAIAQDVVDLVQTLGYTQANLIGADYGTRIALTVLRDYPDTVRSLTLDSPIPINVNYYNERAFYFFGILNDLMIDLMEDEELSEYLDEFESKYYELIANLEFEPVSFLYNNAEGGEEEVFIGSGDVVFNMQKMLSETSLIPAIPAYYSLLFAAEYQQAVDLLEQQAAAIENAPFLESGELAEGLMYSVLCSEEVGFNDAETANAMIETYPKEASDYLLSEIDEMKSFCQVWPVEQAESFENLSFSSEVPILVLSGQYDTLSPPNWGKRLLIDFPNVFTYVFPQMGHYSLNNEECAIPLVEEFVNFPNILPSNTCLDRIDLEPFILP